MVHFGIDLRIRGELFDLFLVDFDRSDWGFIVFIGMVFMASDDSQTLLTVEAYLFGLQENLREKVLHLEDSVELLVVEGFLAKHSL